MIKKIELEKRKRAYAAYKLKMANDTEYRKNRLERLRSNRLKREKLESLAERRARNAQKSREFYAQNKKEITLERKKLREKLPIEVVENKIMIDRYRTLAKFRGKQLRSPETLVGRVLSICEDDIAETLLIKFDRFTAIFRDLQMQFDAADVDYSINFVDKEIKINRNNLIVKSRDYVYKNLLRKPESKGFFVKVIGRIKNIFNK